MNFLDESFWEEWNDRSSENYKYLQEFVHILAVCHTVVPKVSRDGTMSYNASSPDELALTNAARYFGIEFVERDSTNNIILIDKSRDEKISYELLNVIEFTSSRKRMSVIVRSPDDRILCITKGADSVIFPRLQSGQDELIGRTGQHLEQYAKQGLRTLLLAKREIDSQFYQ